MKLNNCYIFKKLNCTIIEQWRNEFVQLLHTEEMKWKNCYILKKLNCTLTEQWRNEIWKLLHNEEMNLYNCCTMKKWNSTIVANWRNQIFQMLNFEEVKLYKFLFNKGDDGEDNYDLQISVLINSEKFGFKKMKDGNLGMFPVTTPMMTMKTTVISTMMMIKSMMMKTSTICRLTNLEKTVLK